MLFINSSWWRCTRDVRVSCGKYGSKIFAKTFKKHLLAELGHSVKPLRSHSGIKAYRLFEIGIECDSFSTTELISIRQLLFV